VPFCMHSCRKSSKWIYAPVVVNLEDKHFLCYLNIGNVSNFTTDLVAFFLPHFKKTFPLIMSVLETTDGINIDLLAYNSFAIFDVGLFGLF